MRRSRPAASRCHGGGEACRGGEGSVLGAGSPGGSSTATLLQVPHQAPARLVQRCRHQGRVHRESSDVEASHPCHRVAARRLTASWGKKCSDGLSPDCRALDWWLYKTILCIFEVVQGLHGFGSSCKLYNMTSSYSEVGIKAVCKSARHLDFQTSLAIVS